MVVFVHGCFWHGHENCKYAEIPKTRSDFWLAKIKQNKLRDMNNIKKLENEGWKLFIIYGCELKNDKKQTILENLLNNIRSQFQS